LNSVDVIGIKNKQRNYDVDASIMARFGLESVCKILETQPSIFIKNYGPGNISTLTIRGTSASHSKIQWNGMEINSPMLGQADLSLIPTFLFNDIEIQQGGYSMAKSNGAFGGNINLISSSEPVDSSSVFISSGIASFQSYNQLVGLNIKSKRLISGSKIYFTNSKNDYSYINTADFYRKKVYQKNSNFMHYGFLQELDFNLNTSTSLSLKYWYNTSDRNIPAIMTISNKLNRIEQQTDENNRLIANLKKDIKWLNINFSNSIDFSSTTYLLSDNGIEMIHTNTNYFQYNSKLDATANLSKNTKLEFFVSNLNTGGLYSDLNSGKAFDCYNNEFSISVNGEQNIGEIFYLNLFGKKLFTAHYQLPIMPSAGFSLHLLKNELLVFKANIAKNYRLPSLNDLYFNPGGNPLLLPENAGLADALLISRLKKWKTSLNSYYSVIKNWILWKPTMFGYWTPTNIDEVITKGADVNINYQSDKKVFAYSIIMNFSYNLTYRLNDTKKNQMLYIPKYASNSVFIITYKQFTIDYTIRYIGVVQTSLAGNNNNLFSELSAYILHDLSFAYTYHNFGLRFSVYNITNQNYQVVAWRPMPGINYALKLNIRL
jgi:outer membrane cobalamin receptor